MYDDSLCVATEPRRTVCGTVMRTADGGYQCGGCGREIDMPSIERPAGGDHLPGIMGG